MDNENNSQVTCKQILLMIIQTLLMIMEILLMIMIIRKKGTMTTMVRLPANNANYYNSEMRMTVIKISKIKNHDDSY